MARRKQGKKAEEIRFGSFAAKLYAATKKVGGSRYDYFRLAYHEPGGRRVVRDFKERADAVSAAKEASRAYALGRPDATSWSARERAEYDAAVQALEGRGVSLFAAVQGYLAKTASEPTEFRTVAEVAAALIEERKGNGCSEVHLRDLTSRLKRITQDFQCPVSSVTADHVREFLRTLKTDDGAQAAPRTRRNYLRIIAALFIFAGKRRWVSADHVSQIREIEAPRVVASSEAEIFSPRDMLAVLNAAKEDLIPALAIGAFAGLRSAELARLDWSDIRLDERVIILAATKTKTASRRIVPIADNLAQWLAPHSRPSGKLNPATNERTLSTRFSRAAARAGIQWVANGMRHSFISYRLAVTHDPARVATEAGNSAGMVHRVYKALVTEAQGKAWFEIRPKEASNVIAMPATA